MPRQLGGSPFSLQPVSLLRRAVCIAGGTVESDPSGSAVSAPADTASTTTTAPATSEPTDASGAAAERQPVSDAANPEPTPDDTSAEDPGENEGAESEEDQPRNDEERKLSRRERQRLREQERIDKAIAEAIAANEREREQAEEVKKRQEAATAAEKARREKLAQFVGTPERLQTLTSERDEITRKINAELLNPAGEDLDALAAQAAEKQSEIDRLRVNQSFEGEIRQDIWSQIEQDFVFPTTFPELSDPQARAAYLHAQGGVKGALVVLADTIRAAKDREWQGKLDAQAKEHDSKLKALAADRDGWRVRAGGGDLAPEDGGTPSVDGTWTRERLRNMPLEEYRKHRASIERAAAAGLIR